MLVSGKILQLRGKDQSKGEHRLVARDRRQDERDPTQARSLLDVSPWLLPAPPWISEPSERGGHGSKKRSL